MCIYGQFVFVCLVCDPDAGQTQRSCRLHFADLNVKKPSLEPTSCKAKMITLSAKTLVFFMLSRDY